MLADGDRFLSRQILTHPAADDKGFVKNLAERVRRARSSSSVLFAASLPHKVRPGAMRGIFESMIGLSDHLAPQALPIISTMSPGSLQELPLRYPDDGRDSRTEPARTRGVLS